MTDTHTPHYYEYWADELNQALGLDTFDADMVADIERLIGKPVAAMTIGDLRRGTELGEREHANAADAFGAN